jgi:peptidoglycan-associated lipoprotein
MTCVRLATAIVLVVPLLAVSCGRRTVPVARATPPPPAVEEAPPAPPPPAVAPETASAVADVPLTEDELFARKTLDELNAERPLGDALFDYDQFTLRSDARTVLQAHAEWLRRWASTRITVEGHADARGTSEYNLALGERRANAAREYLVGLGIDSDRLLVVSKGEESPACVEEHEACWQQNRRAHFIITAK